MGNRPDDDRRRRRVVVSATHDGHGRDRQEPRRSRDRNGVRRMIRTRKDATMVIAMGVLLLFAVYNFVIRPQGSDLSAVRDERITTEQRVRSRVGSPGSARHVGKSVGGRPRRPHGVVPADPAVAELLRQLQAIARRRAWRTARSLHRPGGANPNGPGGSLQIGITASGSHESIARLCATAPRPRSPCRRRAGRLGRPTRRIRPAADLGTRLHQFAAVDATAVAP